MSRRSSNSRSVWRLMRLSFKHQLTMSNIKMLHSSLCCFEKPWSTVNLISHKQLRNISRRGLVNSNKLVYILKLSLLITHHLCFLWILIATIIIHWNNTSYNDSDWGSTSSSEYKCWHFIILRCCKNIHSWWTRKPLEISRLKSDHYWCEVRMWLLSSDSGWS